MRDSEHGPRLEMREPKDHGLSEKEIDAVTGIVDAEKYGFDIEDALSKVTADNAVMIAEEGTERIQENRRDDDFFSEEKLPSALFKEYLDRASRESHAIQCSANKEIDLGVLRDRAREAFSEMPEEMRADVDYVNGLLERQVRMNGLLSEVYIADILRRIAGRKQDPEIMTLGIERLRAVRDEMLETLDGFENAAVAKVQVTPGVPALLENLRKALKEADDAELGRSMYDTVAEPYSMIIGYDSEEFHEQELLEILRELEQE